MHLLQVFLSNSFFSDTMKRLVLIIILSFVSLAISWAQQWIEVVYLTDGGVIKGTVIEQIPEKSIKIQTADGSIFVYEMSRVEKIVKEEVTPTRPNYYRPQQSYSSQQQAQNRPAFVGDESNARQYLSSVNEPYVGRLKEGRFMFDFGAGIAPCNLSIASYFNQAWSQTEFAGYVRSKDIMGMTVRLGGTYERFFKKGSPWFFGGGLSGEWQIFGMNANGTGEFYPGKRIATGRVHFWDILATVSIGFQTQPNVEGLHFYAKAGAGVNYLMIGNIALAVYNPEDGSVYAKQTVAYSDAVSEEEGQSSAICFRPYGEIGFGNDAFFRIGIRYSPIILNQTIHCITLGVSIPF